MGNSEIQFQSEFSIKIWNWFQLEAFPRHRTDSRGSIFSLFFSFLTAEDVRYFVWNVFKQSLFVTIFHFPSPTEFKYMKLWLEYWIEDDTAE